MSYSRKEHVVDVMKRIWGKHTIINHYRSIDNFTDHLTANLYLFDRFTPEQIEYTHKAIQVDRQKSNYLDKPDWMKLVKYASAAPGYNNEPKADTVRSEKDIQRGAEALAKIKAEFDI